MRNPLRFGRCRRRMAARSDETQIGYVVVLGPHSELHIDRRPTLTLVIVHYFCQRLRQERERDDAGASPWLTVGQVRSTRAR